MYGAKFRSWALKKGPPQNGNFVGKRRSSGEIEFWALDRNERYEAWDDEDGGLAQLGERLPCKQEVSGSIPLISTKHKKAGVAKDGPIAQLARAHD